MIRQIVWLAPAADDLSEIEPNLAGDIAAAVKLFALSGVGFVVRMPNPAGPDEYRLYVPPDHLYYARIRHSADIVYVERVFVSP